MNINSKFGFILKLDRDMQGLKPHRLYGASNWLGSKTPSNYLSLTPSLPHSLPLYRERRSSQAPPLHGGVPLTSPEERHEKLQIPRINTKVNKLIFFPSQIESRGYTPPSILYRRSA